MGLSGKGDTSAPATYNSSDSSDSSGDMEMFMQAMMAMAAMDDSESDIPELPEMPEIPEVTRTQDIDWTEKEAQLASKAKADQSLDAARKRGRTSTIHTGSLLDEDETNTTNESILSAKK